MSEAPDPIEKLKDAREFVQGNSDTEFLLVRKEGNGADVGKLNIGYQVEQELDKTVEDELTEHIDKLREGKALSRPLDVANTVVLNTDKQLTPGFPCTDELEVWLWVFCVGRCWMVCFRVKDIKEFPIR